MNPQFKASVSPPDTLERPVKWFIFRGFRLLVQIDDSQARLPELESPIELGLHVVRQQYLGLLNNQHCFSAEVTKGVAPPQGWDFQGLRRIFGVLPEELFWIAGAAVQIVDWDRNHQYCGRCGEATTDLSRERAKECKNCGLISYPRISPAIIVLIENDEKLLLARSLRHPLGLYSVLAGFVEAGETLEDTVIREIREEVGLEVKDIRYFGSQPWPFPNSLMIAFTCIYDSGSISIDEDEMADAGWYTVDNLPMIPPKISIARQMIDWFVARHTNN